MCFLAEQVYWHSILLDPARPFRRAPRPDPTVVCPGFGFDKWILQLVIVVVGLGLRLIPGHALHEKGLQKQIGVGTLVSSQERRALFVLLINHGSAADKPVVNRWSTAGFVPPSVLNTNEIVRASEETFRTVFSIRWGARGWVVSWPDRPNGVPSFPAPPRPAPPPCAAPTRPARGVSGFWIRQVITVVVVVRMGAGVGLGVGVVFVVHGHALHEKVLQRQNGDGTLVRSRERRAAVVPVPGTNWLSTVGQPDVLFRLRFS